MPYARVTRALYRGNEVRAYAAGTILGALLTVVATGTAFMREGSAVVAWSLASSLVATAIGFVSTARNLPAMRDLWETSDDDTGHIMTLLGRWERWHLIGAVSHVAAFVVLVVALAGI